MNCTMHTPNQLVFAERVSKAMANVPPDRRPMLETLVETLLTGASLATPINNRQEAAESTTKSVK